MDGIDFLWQQATCQMADEMQHVDSRNNSLEKSDDAISCYCCGRPSNQWAVPLYQPRIDGYIREEVPICAPCNAMFHGSYRYLGMEKGSPEKPGPAGKLGMLVGCGLLVTQKQRIFLTNPGWDKRLRLAVEPIFELRQVSGKGALDYALNIIMDLSQDAFPLLYVCDLGRKKAELVTNMKLTHSKEQVYVCSAEVTYRLNTALVHTIRMMLTQDKSSWKKLESFILKGCHGLIAPNDPGLHEFLSGNPEALAIARSLPADPHEKLQLLRVVG